MSERSSIQEAKKGSGELLILALLGSRSLHASQRADWARFFAALGMVAGVKPA